MENNWWKQCSSREEISIENLGFEIEKNPDWTPSKYKARFFIREDLQIEDVDYYKKYAHVVQWSTVLLVLTMLLSHGWYTKQVDYSNKFCQADMKEEVCIELPKIFGGVDKTPKVLRLLKSLYGLKQAPKTFFDKLKAGLLERNFVQSQIYKCLFVKGIMSKFG